jgi:ribosomal protein L7/L12
MDDDVSRSKDARELSGAAVAALMKGNKIEAIKRLREERGIGLKEARDMVDGYVAGHPGLKRKFDAQQAEAMRGFLLWLAGLIALATVAYFVISGQ